MLTVVGSVFIVSGSSWLAHPDSKAQRGKLFDEEAERERPINQAEIFQALASG